jgi:Protein of unknown function (DUF2934)
VARHRRVCLLDRHLDRDRALSKGGDQMTEKSTKPAVRRPRTAKPRTKRRNPTHEEIATRAYFIHLDEGGRDELENWLRAERELLAA